MAGDDNDAHVDESSDSDISTADTSAMDILGEAQHPQLTVKAIIAGIMAGSFGAFLTIYYGLKTGITPALNIISALLGFAFVQLLMKCGICGGKFTPQETCVIQTTAVACTQVATASGFFTCLLAMTPDAANLMQIPGSRLDDVIDLTYGKNVLWCAALAFFGLFVAFPLRSYCIIERKLPYPSGTATATVIRTLHTDPSHVHMSLKLLGRFALITFCWSMFLWCFEGLGSFPIFGITAAEYGWKMDWDISQFAIGMLLGPNINLSTLAGAFVGMGVMKPLIKSNHFCEAGSSDPSCWYYSDAPKYMDLRAYTMFPGIAMIVVDGLYSIAKLVLLLIKGLLKPKATSTRDMSEKEEEVKGYDLQEALNRIFHSASFPWWTYAGGYVVAALLCVLVVSSQFGVAWYQVLVATLLTPFFSVGIIVGMGLTDWDCSGSFGKLMLFPFGAWNHGGSLIPALAVCQITISGCGAAAHLMQDFKTGYLVGASPRAMVIAQLIGAAAGCLISPFVFTLFTSAYTLPNDDPHQSIHGVFGAIYRVFATITTTQGLSALPKYSQTFAIASGALALGLDLGVDIGRTSLPGLVRCIPSPMGLALGLLIGPYLGIDFCIGNLLQMLWRRRAPREEAKYCTVVASGCLAGAGLATLMQVFLSLAGVVSPINVSFKAAGG